MPKAIGEFFNDLALKAGLKSDDELLKNVLSAPDLQKVMVPDELIAGIDNGLLSIEAAKNNHPDIKKHYMAAAYNGLDSEIDAVMNELQLPDDVKLVIKNERSSTKRAALLTKKVKELESAKKNTDDKGEKASLQKEIDELRAKMRQETEKVEQVRAEYENKFANMRLQSELDKVLNTYKTVFDDLDPDSRNTALTTTINKVLQDKNAEFKIDENGRLQLVRKDGANVFGDDNRQWNPQILIDQALSQKKLLKISDPKPPTGNGGNNNPVIVDNNNDNGQPKKNADPTLKNLAQQALKDLENAGKMSVM